MTLITLIALWQVMTGKNKDLPGFINEKIKDYTGRMR